MTRFVDKVEPAVMISVDFKADGSADIKMVCGNDVQIPFTFKPDGTVNSHALSSAAAKRMGIQTDDQNHILIGIGA